MTHAITAAQLKDILQYNILVSVYPKNPETTEQKELAQKIEALYTQKYNGDINAVIRGSVEPVFVEAAHGMGKNTAYGEAVKAVATELGLTVAQNPSNPDYIAAPNELVYWVIEGDMADPNMPNTILNALCREKGLPIIDTPLSGLLGSPTRQDTSKASATVMLFDNVDFLPDSQINQIVNLLDYSRGATTNNSGAPTHIDDIKPRRIPYLGFTATPQDPSISNPQLMALESLCTKFGLVTPSVSAKIQARRDTEGGYQIEHSPAKPKTI